MENLQSARHKTVVGFSHDLRNPLTVLKSAIDYLELYADTLGEEGPSLIDDLKVSVGNMERLLRELMSVTTSQSHLVALSPVEIDVGPLIERLRRRLIAIVHGRPIRVVVTGGADLPKTIEIDELLFDRIIDNLLTNAAKYTERGSITMDLERDREFLVIHISDTGRGIEPERLHQVFEAGASDPTHRAPDSYGVGLSVVVALLGLIGGQLEVMSNRNRDSVLGASPHPRHRGAGVPAAGRERRQRSSVL